MNKKTIDTTESLVKRARENRSGNEQTIPSSTKDSILGHKPLSSLGEEITLTVYAHGAGVKKNKKIGGGESSS